MDKPFKVNQTFWLIMGIVAVIMIVLLAYALSVSKPSVEPDVIPAAIKPAVFNPQAGLGEEGAECGGEMNLPCRPGLLVWAPPRSKTRVFVPKSRIKIRAG